MLFPSTAKEAFQQYKSLTQLILAQTDFIKTHFTYSSTRCQMKWQLENDVSFVYNIKSDSKQISLTLKKENHAESFIVRIDDFAVAEPVIRSMLSA